MGVIVLAITGLGEKLFSFLISTEMNNLRAPSNENEPNESLKSMIDSCLSVAPNFVDCKKHGGMS